MRAVEIFRRPAVGPLSLSEAMAAVKASERLLIVGSGQPKLLATLASKTGLTGRVVAVTSDEAGAEALRTAAAGAGIGIEAAPAPWTSFPVDAAAFDVVLVDSTRGLLATLSPGDRVACLEQARRALRAGGRATVIERPGGLAGLFRREPSEYLASHGAVGALDRAGFRPVRLLAERAGWRFTEGLKQNE